MNNPMKWPSFNFIITLVLIDSLLPTIKNILLNKVDWWILLSIFGTFCIFYAIYLRQLWGYKLAVFVFGLKTVSEIIFIPFYLKQFGFSGIISDPKLFIINSISFLSLLISLPLFVFFINLWRIYRPKRMVKEE
mgnify:FL=1